MAENLEKNTEQRKEQQSLFSLSFPGNDWFGGFSDSTQNPLPPPPPCVEVFCSEVASPVKYTADPVNLNGGLSLLKGRVSTYDVFGVKDSDLVPGKYEGGLKLWEGSLDLVKALNSEVQDGLLSLTGKRVLELGCGHGLPGIFMCHKGAAAIHFQDFNAEVLQCLTIPNLIANVAENSLLQQSLLKNHRETNVGPEIRFFAGDWSEIHHLLLQSSDLEFQKTLESGSKQDQCDGYDIILMAETVYSPPSLQSLYQLIKKCLRRPSGIVYLAAKKYYFGVGGGTRQFRSIIEHDGVLDSFLIAEVADGSSNVREVWKFSFKE